MKLVWMIIMALNMGILLLVQANNLPPNPTSPSSPSSLPPLYVDSKIPRIPRIPKISEIPLPPMVLSFIYCVSIHQKCQGAKPYKIHLGCTSICVLIKCRHPSRLDIAYDDCALGCATNSRYGINFLNLSQFFI